MKITNKQKKLIDDLLEKELQELRSIFKEIEDEEMEIEIELPENLDELSYCYLVINKKEIKILDDNDDIYCILEKRSLPGVNRKPSDYEKALKFSENYLEIKQRFIEKVKNIKSFNKEQFQKLMAVKKSFEGYPELEIEYPLTNMTYQEEEKDLINNTLDKVIEDLNNIWIASKNEETEIPIQLEQINKVNNFLHTNISFKISQRGFYFEIYPSILTQPPIQVYLAKLSPLGEVQLTNSEISTELKSEFIRKYQTIRERIIFQIEQQKQERAKKIADYENAKQTEMAEIKNINQMYSKTVDLEINLPPALNQHIVEVVEENGRKIGTLNFGNASIRIITQGDISIVKKENPSEKQKKL